MEEQNQATGPKTMDHKPIVGAILIVGLMIAGAILLKGGGNTNLANNNNNIDDQVPNIPEPRKVSSSDHIIGSPNAEVVIIEYSDTECPFCKVFHNTMHQVIDKTEGKVAWVYRHYPIPQLHQKAQFEAEATECAWEQGGNETFWKYIDEIFARTGSNDKLPIEELGKIATELGLDMTKFNECLESGKYESKVANDVADAKLAGVRGTPTSYILVNGKVVDAINGAASLETVLAQIENL